MSAQSSDVVNMIAQLRAKQALGTLTLEDEKLAIKLLRADRLSAAERAATRTRAAKLPAKSAEDLLGELDKM